MGLCQASQASKRPMALQLVGPSYTPHPLVWTLVAPLVSHSDHAAARLAFRDLAAALDAGPSTAPRQLRISSWQEAQPLHTLSAALQHSITRLEASDVKTAADWQTMLAFAAHNLPQLCSLRCSGRRTWPPQRAEEDVSNGGSGTAGRIAGQQPLQQLQAVSFAGFVTSLSDLASLAPRLAHLFCDRLVLHSVSSSSRSNGSSGKQGTAAAGQGSLPGVTHFGADAVTIAAGDEGEVAAALAAALPSLQVLSHLPVFKFEAPGGANIRRRILPAAAALAACSGIRAVRTYGSSTDMAGLPPQQLQGLQLLQQLSVYGIGPAVELRGICKLTQLTALSLAIECGKDKRNETKLLQELARLPLLQQLALPAKLLCSSCTQQGRELWALLAHRMQRCTCDGGGSRTGSGSGVPCVEPRASNGRSAGAAINFKVLRQLLLMYRPHAQDRRCQVGDHCKHMSLQQQRQAVAGVIGACGFGAQNAGPVGTVDQAGTARAAGTSVGAAAMPQPPQMGCSRYAAGKAEVPHAGDSVAEPAAAAAAAAGDGAAASSVAECVDGLVVDVVVMDADATRPSWLAENARPGGSDLLIQEPWGVFGPPRWWE